AKRVLEGGEAVFGIALAGTAAMGTHDGQCVIPAAKEALQFLRCLRGEAMECHLSRFLRGDEGTEKCEEQYRVERVAKHGWLLRERGDLKNPSHALQAC